MLMSLRIIDIFYLLGYWLICKNNFFIFHFSFSTGHMPLFYQHNINESTKLGVWRIEEPENFFLQRVPLKNNVTHPYKKLQHLAGRYLLPVLFEDFPLQEIVIADTKKPFLKNEMYHFYI